MAFKKQTPVQEQPESGKTPVHQISLPAGKGAQIQASVWENEVQNGENSFTSYSVTFARRYRDDEEWKSSYGFRASDLLLVAKAAQMAFDAILEAKNG